MANKALNLNPKKHNAHLVYQRPVPKQQRFNENLEDACSNAKLSHMSEKNLWKFNKANADKVSNAP